MSQGCWTFEVYMSNIRNVSWPWAVSLVKPRTFQYTSECMAQHEGTQIHTVLYILGRHSRWAFDMFELYEVNDKKYSSVKGRYDA